MFRDRQVKDLEPPAYEGKGARRDDCPGGREGDEGIEEGAGAGDLDGVGAVEFGEEGFPGLDVFPGGLFRGEYLEHVYCSAAVGGLEDDFGAYADVVADAGGVVVNFWV